MLAYVATKDSPRHFALRDVDDPSPGVGSPVVRVAAFSLNRGEVGHITGLAEGTVLGWDVAGVVESAATDGSGPPAGTRVFGFSQARGAWAEKVAVPVATLAVAPAGLTDAAGSTLGVAGLTALYALRRAGSLLGRTVIITGAAGGVGRLAVQLAVLSGARVIGVVGDGPGRADAVLGLGLDGVTVERGLAEVGPSAHLVLESVGGESLTAAFRRVAPGGTIVTYGRSSGQPGAVPPDWFFRNARVEGLPFSTDLAVDQTSPTALEILGALVAEKRLDPGISVETDWAELPAAIDALVGRQVAGKAVLHVK